jgi:hypothetical protein
MQNVLWNIDKNLYFAIKTFVVELVVCEAVDVPCMSGSAHVMYRLYGCVVQCTCTNHSVVLKCTCTDHRVVLNAWRYLVLQICHLTTSPVIRQVTVLPRTRLASSGKTHSPHLTRPTLPSSERDTAEALTLCDILWKDSRVKQQQILSDDD